MPSAMIPTFTPVPSTIWLAASTFMTWRASGSISGCAGSDGQICCEAAWGVPAGRRWATERVDAAPDALPSGASRRMASGTTARTAGSPLSRLISAEEIVAETALTMWKLCTCVA
jgi:hypothetical protein